MNLGTIDFNALFRQQISPLELRVSEREKKETTYMFYMNLYELNETRRK